MLENEGGLRAAQAQEQYRSRMFWRLRGTVAGESLGRLVRFKY